MGKNGEENVELEEDVTWEQVLDRLFKIKTAYGFQKLFSAEDKKIKALFLVRPAVFQVYSGRGEININGEPLSYSIFSNPYINIPANSLVTIHPDAKQNTSIHILLSEPHQIYKKENNSADTIHSGVSLAFDYIREHYTESLKIEDLANIANMSACYFGQKFIDTYKISALNLVRLIRVFNALDIMLNQNLKYVDISNELGFCDQSHFNKSFKSVLGACPKAIFKQLRKNTISQENYFPNVKKVEDFKKLTCGLYGI